MRKIKRAAIRWRLRAVVSLGVASLALSATFVGGTAARAAASSIPTEPPQLAAAVGYLKGAQNSDGGLPSTPGGASSEDISSWGAIALAAAGDNIQTQSKDGGISLYSYLTSNIADFSVTTDYARNLLVVDAAGTDPYSFGGLNLVSKIEAAQITSGADAGAFAHTAGSTTPGVNDTIFAILSLAPVSGTQSVVASAAHWLLADQNSDGGWPATTAGGSSDGDMTGATLEALVAATPDDEADAAAIASAEAKAVSWLPSLQNSDGGFYEEEDYGTSSDTASTAWIAQGLIAADTDPATVTSSGESPINYLINEQQSDGAEYYTGMTNESPVWMTAYAAPVFAGKALPVVATSLSPGGSTTIARPTLTKLSQSHRRWREGRKLASIARQSKRAPVGTVFRFTLNEAATVKLAFTHKIAGRRVRGRCAAPKRSNRRHVQCTRTVTVGTLSMRGRQGADRVSFDGRISRKRRLKPSRYTMVLTATKSGKASAAHRLTFTVVR